MVRSAEQVDVAKINCLCKNHGEFIQQITYDGNKFVLSLDLTAAFLNKIEMNRQEPNEKNFDIIVKLNSERHREFDTFLSSHAKRNKCQCAHESTHAELSIDVTSENTNAVTFQSKCGTRETK